MSECEFIDGEYAEGYPWELVEGAEIRADYACKHATAQREETKTRFDGNPLVYKYVTVPRLLRAHNEGHCNITLLCLDCVLEAVK